MREIKFRAFNLSTNRMEFADRLTIPGGWREGAHQVMQFTGLKDKNGKEIYEGDIVRVYWGEMEKSEYLLQQFIKPFPIEFRNYGWFPFTHALPMPKNIEIIGNIYENPELLN